MDAQVFIYPKNTDFYVYILGLDDNLLVFDKSVLQNKNACLQKLQYCL